MRIGFLIPVLVFACSSAPKQAPSYFIEADRWPETKPLPVVDSDTLPLPPKLDPIESSQALEKGIVAPSSGILISEAKAWRLAQSRIEAKALRSDWIADREVWVAHRAVYESTIQNMAEQIRNLQPSWFDENKISIGLGGGFILGAVTVVLLAYAYQHIAVTP